MVMFEHKLPVSIKRTQMACEGLFDLSQGRHDSRSGSSRFQFEVLRSAITHDRSFLMKEQYVFQKLPEDIKRKIDLSPNR